MMCFVVSSTLGNQRKIGELVKEGVSSILKDLDVKLITDASDCEELEGIDYGCTIVVATGGTERLILKILDKIQKPALLWALPSNNSLPSALEVYSKLRHKPIKLFYSPLDASAVAEVESFVQVCEALEKLSKSKLGCIGGISEWILTSDEKEIEDFGVKIVKIDLNELIDEIKRVDENKAEEIAKSLIDKFDSVEVPKEEIVKSAKVYLALKRIISRYDLSAITVKCFDLLKEDVTACLGLSLCNDERITAGCEGDLQATLTMMIVSFVTKLPCWMANTCRIDVEENTVTLAHCTIATEMIDPAKSSLKTHRESGKSVAIDGLLKDSDVTLVRFGNGKMLIAPGKIVRSCMNDDGLCRTQAEVKLKGSVEDFIANALGNHVVLAYGNIEQKLLDFCKFKGIKAIVIE
jgi:L-fucose isomerase-like protein